MTTFIDSVVSNLILQFQRKLSEVREGCRRHDLNGYLLVLCRVLQVDFVARCCKMNKVVVVEEMCWVL